MTVAAAEPQRWYGGEHRAHVRVRVALHATCVPTRRDGTCGPKFSATTIDLSAGGVALRTPRGVLPPLDLSACGVAPRSPHGVPPPSLVVHLTSDAPSLDVGVAGTVVRLAIADDSVVLGVHFTRLDPATRRLLTTFVLSEAARTGAFTSPVRRHNGGNLGGLA